MRPARGVADRQEIIPESTRAGVYRAFRLDWAGVGMGVTAGTSGVGVKVGGMLL